MEKPGLLNGIFLKLITDSIKKKSWIKNGQGAIFWRKGMDNMTLFLSCWGYFCY